MIEILNRINQNLISRQPRSNSWLVVVGQQEVSRVTRTQCWPRNKKLSSRRRVQRRTTRCWVMMSIRTTLTLQQSKTTSRRSSTTLTSHGSRRWLATREALLKSWIATRSLSLRNLSRSAASRLIKLWRWLNNLSLTMLYNNHTIKSSNRNRIRKGGSYLMTRTPMAVRMMR